MDPEELNALEQELHGLVPAAVPVELKERLEEALDASPSGRRSRMYLVWPMGLAAAILWALGVWYENRAVPEPSPAVAEIDWKPVADPSAPVMDRLIPRGAEYVVREPIDEGVFLVDGLGPVRRLRYPSLTHARWEHPDTGQAVTMTLPRDEVVYVKLRQPF